MKAAGGYASMMWRWHVATSQDVPMELPQGLEFRLKLARISVNTGFFGLVCGLTLVSKKFEFQLKLFFCGCRFVFCVVPPMPNKTQSPVQPFIDEDVDNTRTLCLQCLFSQNLWELNFFLDLYPSVKLNWTRPAGSKVIRGRQNKHSMSALTLFSQELGWKSSLSLPKHRGLEEM